MKLVLAAPLYPPESGGPATYAKLLMEGLPTKDIEIRLVKFSDVRTYPSGVRHFMYMIKVMKAAKDADVILALDPVSVGLPAALAAGFAHKPLVVKIVGDFAWEQGRQRFGIKSMLDEFVHERNVPFMVACMRFVQVFVARRAQRIIVPSNYLKTIIATWSPNILAEKVSVIYNSIDVSKSIGEKGLKPQVTNHSIISVARLVPWKGLAELIKAVTQVKQQLPDTTLTIVGDGPDKQLLVKKGNELMAGSITFTGQISNEETLQRMCNSEVLVLNSTYEGLSHLLIEGLMLGCSIIASRAGGNPELIQNGENGLLVPVGDTTALTKALLQLLQDSALRASLGKRALESSRRFSLAAMLDHTASLLTSLL